MQGKPEYTKIIKAQARTNHKNLRKKEENLKSEYCQDLKNLMYTVNVQEPTISLLGLSC